MPEEIKCNRCGAVDYTNAGLQWRDGKRDVQRRRCRACGKVWVQPPEVEKEIK